VPAVTFSFDGGLLTVTGTNQAETITVRSDPATGNVFVNNQLTGATLATLDGLVVNANGGNDTLNVSQLASSLDRAELNGGGGNDVFLGGAGEEVINGGAGDDTVVRPNSGDTIDLGLGEDGVVFDGTADDDVIIVRRQVTTEGPFVVVQLNTQTIEVLFRNSETVTVNGLGGDDLIVTDPSQFIWSMHLNGGAGDDVLMGGVVGDVLNGGGGRDALVGRGGDDVLRGGAGNDALDGGDGNDYLLGEGGRDKLTGGVGEDVMIGGAGADEYDALDGVLDFIVVDDDDVDPLRDATDVVL
jgi:Ca2+-binding RTX toxin-like protein